MMACITRVSPVPSVLKPMLMIFRRRRESDIGARCEEQAEPLGRPARSGVPAPAHRESRSLKTLDQYVDGKSLDVCKREHRPLRGAILVDLRKFAADLVELAADSIDQVEPLRGQKDGPFRALAI